MYAGGPIRQESLGAFGVIDFIRHRFQLLPFAGQVIFQAWQISRFGDQAIYGAGGLVTFGGNNPADDFFGIGWTNAESVRQLCEPENLSRCF